METYNTSEIKSREKRKKINGYIILIFGILMIVLGLFLYFEVDDNTEINLIVIALLYEYLGEMGVIILGGLMIYDGVKKLKKTDAQKE